MADGEPLAPSSSSETEYSFTLLGKACTISTETFCSVGTKNRAAFDADSNGMLSKKEFSAYLKWSTEKIIEEKKSGALASGLVRFVRMVLLLTCALGGLYYAKGMVINNINVYDGIDPVGALSFQYTPASLASETCTDASDDIKGEGFARIGNVGVNIADAKKDYYGTTMGGMADPSHDILRMTFIEADPAGGPIPTTIPGIYETHFYSRPIYSRLYPTFLRAFSLGAFQVRSRPPHLSPPSHDRPRCPVLSTVLTIAPPLVPPPPPAHVPQLKLGLATVYVTPGECSDGAYVKKASVAAAGYLFGRARGSDGLVAVARNSLPANGQLSDGSDIDTAWPELAASIAISGDYIRFNCGPSAPPHTAPSGIQLHPFGGVSCAPFTTTDLNNDQNHNVFIGLDLIIVFFASIFAIFQLRDTVCDVFVSVVHSIGPEAFIERADLAAPPADGKIVEVIVDAAGPLFFIDFLVATPRSCATNMYNGIVSTVLHFLFIVLPSIPLICMIALLGCERLDEFDSASDAACEPRLISQIVFLGIVVQWAAGITYAISWYLDLPSALQSLLKKLAMLTYMIVSIAAVVYLIQAACLMFIAIAVKPQASITTLVLVGTPFLYAYITANSLMSAKPPPPAIDILTACATGAVVLLALVGWMCLALVVFLPPSGNALGPLGASLGTVSSAIALGSSQISKLNKMASEQSSTMGAFSA